MIGSRVWGTLGTPQSSSAPLGAARARTIVTIVYCGFMEMLHIQLGPSFWKALSLILASAVPPHSINETSPQPPS